jgi:hypothetical protein
LLRGFAARPALRSGPLPQAATSNPAQRRVVELPASWFVVAEMIFLGSYFLTFRLPQILPTRHSEVVANLRLVASHRFRLDPALLPTIDSILSAH